VPSIFGDSRGGRRALRLLALAVAAIISTATLPAPSARAEPRKPQPQVLWHAYPLNPVPGRSRAGTAERRGTAGQSGLAAPATRHSGGVSWWVIVPAVAGFMLLVVVTGVMLARRAGRPIRVPLRLSTARARVAVEAIAAAASRGTNAGKAGMRRVANVIRGWRPRLRRPGLPRLAAPAVPVLPDDLLESLRRRVRAPERTVGALDAPSQPRPQPAVSAPEDNVLKRKIVAARADETAKLKAKTQAAGPHRVDEPDEADAFKAKLLSISARDTGSEPKAQAAPEPVTAPVELHARRVVGSAAPALETLPPMPRREVPRPARRPRPAVCRIDWWRGYRRSHFDARVRSTDGGYVAIETSPSFRWSKSTPPPMHLPHIADAHAALLSQLEQNGWVVTGRGEHWYALELRQAKADDSQMKGDA
jgi:hypothetical protein